MVSTRLLFMAASLAPLALFACGEPPPLDEPEPEPECREHLDCRDRMTPYCHSAKQECEPMPAAYHIGWGHNDPDAAAFELVYQAPDGMEAMDADFRTGTNELWIAIRYPLPRRSCTRQDEAADACRQLGGKVAVLRNAMSRRGRTEVLADPNAWHFMRLPTSLVFGEGDFFATCGEARTCNFDDERSDFCGPTLWTAEESVFAKHFPGLNGAHMDMLHESPWCMGMVHEEHNVYWAFNGRDGSIDRYDFAADHGPGESEHSDGMVMRYLNGELSRTPGVPSQMVIDHESRRLYVADSGNGRILRLDMDSGRPGANLSTTNFDELQVRHHVDESRWEIFPVEEGALTKPSGVLLVDDVLYVADHRYAEISAFDLDGNLLRRLPTDFPPDSLGTLTLGPDDQIYITLPREGQVFRLHYDPLYFPED